MYVEVLAKRDDDSDEEARGKTAWVNSDDSLLSLQTSRPEHLGRPNWHIQINAQSTRTVSSGERGGEPRYMNHQLEIHLTPRDLVAIVNFAIEHRLVAVVSAA